MSSAEPDKLVADAQKTFDNFLRDPAQTWVQENLGRARAVLIAPQIVKAGFIFGGSGGRAVLVARDGRAWYGPAFYDLATMSKMKRASTRGMCGLRSVRGRYFPSSLRVVRSGESARR